MKSNIFQIACYRCFK